MYYGPDGSCTGEDFEPGFVNIAGYLYYVDEDGEFVFGETVDGMAFGEDGRYTSGSAELDALVAAELIPICAEYETREERLRAAFPDYDFFRAFTSGMVARKIEREEGVRIPTPEELMEQLATEAYEEVRCQSLHVIFGQEYEKLVAQLRPYCGRFARLLIGRPLLWYNEDYLRLSRALLAEMPHLAPDEA